jgi:hypothetical protein
MASKRRKVLLNKKPSSNVQQMLAEDVRSALNASNKSGPSSSQQNVSGSSASNNHSNASVDDIVASISSDPTIVNAYREEVKGSVSQRVKNDDDFKPEKFPSSSKHFK